MYINPDFILLLKYVASVAILFGILMLPAYLARINGKDKYNMLFVRISSWLFGWTGVGWLLGLFWGTRKESY